MREWDIDNRIFALDVERNNLLAEKRKLQFESVLPELRKQYEGNFYASADSHETQGVFYRVLDIVSSTKVLAMVLENYHYKTTLTPCTEVDMELLEVRIYEFDFLMVMEDAKNKYESN